MISDRGSINEKSISSGVLIYIGFSKLKNFKVDWEGKKESVKCENSLYIH